ncbi:MAG TPA: hypothetical protein VIL99_16255 [Ignavibacteria bacterium]
MKIFLENIYLIGVNVLKFVEDTFGLTHAEDCVLGFFILLPIILFLLIFYLLKYKQKINNLEFLLKQKIERSD